MRNSFAAFFVSGDGCAEAVVDRPILAAKAAPGFDGIL